MREASSRHARRGPHRGGRERARLRSGGGHGGEEASSARTRTSRSWVRPLAALEGADALAVITEWQEFRSPDFAALKAKLKVPAIFDGRNLYDPGRVEKPGIRVLRHREKRRRHLEGPRAGGRRRDARPLLVRRGVAHLAGGAGARGADHRTRSKGWAARRTSRGTARRWARARRLLSVVGARRAGRAARAPDREGGHRREPAPRRQARHHAEAARHRPPAAAPAHRLREAAVARGAGGEAGGVRAARSPSTDVVVLSDYGKGGLDAHRRHDPRGAQGGAARARRPEGRRLRPLQGREHHHAEPRRAARGRRPLEGREGPEEPRQCVARQARPRGASPHARRGGHDALHARRARNTIRPRHARSSTSPARATR